MLSRSTRVSAIGSSQGDAARKFRSVAIPLAHNISTPFWTTDTLASPTERVFPADRAVPDATSDDPIAGANILTEKSSVAFPQPTGSNVATDHPAAISARVPIGPA